MSCNEEYEVERIVFDVKRKLYLEYNWSGIYVDFPVTSLISFAVTSENSRTVEGPWRLYYLDF